MFGLENRGETFIFMSRHSGDYFVLKISKMIYSKKKIKSLKYFPSTFYTADFQIHFVQGGVQLACG